MAEPGEGVPKYPTDEIARAAFRAPINESHHNFIEVDTTIGHLVIDVFDVGPPSQRDLEAYRNGDAI